MTYVFDFASGCVVAPNKEQLKKECAGIAAQITSGENKMSGLRKSWDSQAGYLQRVGNSFAQDNGQYKSDAISFFRDVGGDLAFQYATGKLLPGGLNDFAGEVKDSVSGAGDGDAGAWSTLGHLTLGTYFVTNIVRPSIYRSPNFAAISKYGGAALLIGSVAIKGYEHFGSTIYNEWQQRSIMQAGYQELAGLRDQYSQQESQVSQLQQQFTAKGCDKL